MHNSKIDDYFKKGKSTPIKKTTTTKSNFYDECLKQQVEMCNRLDCCSNKNAQSKRFVNNRKNQSKFKKELERVHVSATKKNIKSKF